MGKYAVNTDVSSDQSKREIEHTLVRYGASQFMYGYQEAGAVIGFRLEKRMFRIDIPMPDKSDPAFRARASNQHGDKGAFMQSAYDQAVKQRWRAAALYIKATLEAVEAGITSLESALLSNLLLPNNQTFGKWAAPQVEQMYLTGAMPQNLPGLPSPRGEN